ncbi:MAG: dihydroorotase [Clostridiales bacterium]|nr:dihydroorotase [Clostridiales bacterium]
MKQIIKNGFVVNPAKNFAEKADILINYGVIERVAENIDDYDAKVIDASGLIVAPGLVDLHVHFREPGYEHKEDITSGSRAAVKGGVTTVLCMPNTNPPIDNAALVEYVINKGKKTGLVNVLTTACITKGQEGAELTEMAELKEAGASAFSDDGKPVSSSMIMRRALEYSKMLDMPIMSHSEDLALVDNGSMNDGYTATCLGLRGIPKSAESAAVSRDILLAEELDARLHVCHVSTKNSIEAVRAAKARGARITAETAPHYFTLTDKACDGFNTNAKMNPPLRDDEDVEAVIRGLCDGTIDSIATDHAPHHVDDKRVEFEKAANGIVGLETSLALGYTYLVKTGRMSLLQLIDCMSTKPAAIIGSDRGTLNVGAPADIVIFDTNEEFTVKISEFETKGKNSPYDGWKLFGKVRQTINGGRTVYRG